MHVHSLKKVLKGCTTVIMILFQKKWYTRMVFDPKPSQIMVFYHLMAQKKMLLIFLSIFTPCFSENTSRIPIFLIVKEDAMFKYFF